MESTWTIRILDAAPRLTWTSFDFTGTYREAVSRSHRAWRETRRDVRLCRQGEEQFWHRVNRAGLAMDDNGNSGVTQRQLLAA